MEIKLLIKELTAAPFKVRSYDPDEDDVRSILGDVCSLIEASATFSVSGFGQDIWPVDVHTDLPVFLEQLPAAIRSVDQHRAATIDFYEQGVERSIDFVVIEGGYLARCASATEWQPDPATENIGRAALSEMLRAIRDVFMRALNDVAPQLARHPWVLQWLEGLSD